MLRALLNRSKYKHEGVDLGKAVAEYFVRGLFTLRKVRRSAWEYWASDNKLFTMTASRGLVYVPADCMWPDVIEAASRLSTWLSEEPLGIGVVLHVKNYDLSMRAKFKLMLRRRLPAPGIIRGIDKNELGKLVWKSVFKSLAIDGEEAVRFECPRKLGFMHLANRDVVLAFIGVGLFPLHRGM